MLKLKLNLAILWRVNALKKLLSTLSPNTDVHYKKNLFSAENSSCSLDDSLTNMQWLFNLDSNPLQEGKKRGDPPSDNESMRPMNPYPKPPFSYASLILLAINSTLEKRMTLQSIYQWIENNFPYYKHCKKAWKVISL